MLVAGLVALTAGVILSGCRADDATKPAVTVSSDRDYAQIPQARGLPRIGVDGQPGSPISWRLPPGTRPDDPVGIAQRFISLYAHAGTPGADPDPALATNVAADDGWLPRLRSRLIDPSRLGDEPRRGPLWVWLDRAQEQGDRATVRGCADVAFFGPESSGRAVRPAPQAWYTELRRVEDSDGRTVWKVSRFNAGPLREGDAFEARCPAWARHRP